MFRFDSRPEVIVVDRTSVAIVVAVASPDPGRGYFSGGEEFRALREPARTWDAKRWQA
jgi:hypothetical protein